MSSRTATKAPAVALDSAAWIEAALDALAVGGIDAVRIDPLAKQLGVTRGSFYWHFTDRAALHQAILKQWRTYANKQVGSRIESRASEPGERLRQVLALPNSTPRAKRAAAIELAIRLWARRDADAARAVRNIDRGRLDYFAKIYVEMGYAPADARRQAFLFYAALMARGFIVTDADTDVSGELAEMLVGE